jgi:hypothetical protein
MGSGTNADYRVFDVTCQDGRIETHRAWVLPISKIAIFENVDNDNSEVITNATVAH